MEKRPELSRSDSSKMPVTPTVRRTDDYVVTPTSIKDKDANSYDDHNSYELSSPLSPLRSLYSSFHRISSSASMSVIDTPKLLKASGKLASGLLHASETGMEKSMRAINSASKLLQETVSHAAAVGKRTAATAAAVTKQYIERHQRIAEMDSRRRDGMVALHDAVINIRGTFVPGLPLIERQWYIGVYPQVSVHDDALIDYRDTKIRTIEEENEDDAIKKFKQKYKIPLDGPDFDLHCKERVESLKIRPFAQSSFHGLSYFAHLTDLSRYTDVGIVIYIETHNVALTSESYVSPINKKGLEGMTSLQAQVDHRRKFVIAYFGKISLVGGSAFGPCGGRMFLTLKPNNPDLSILPHSHKLIDTRGLDVLVSLLPVSQPSSYYLQGFRSLTRPAPCYPSNLVDAESLEPTVLEWDAFNGSVLAMNAFRNRIIVSIKTSKAVAQLIEYDINGKYIGELAPIIDTSCGKITLMLTGHRHLACCTAKGIIILVSLQRNDKDITENKPTDWKYSANIPAHPPSIPITCGCVLGHAGMDIIFTCDKENKIGVNFTDQKGLLRSFLNEPFIASGRIVGLCAVNNRLYVPVSEGNIITIDLTSILDGFIEYSSMLHRYVIREESIFPPIMGKEEKRDKKKKSTRVAESSKGAGISCVAIYAGNTFLGLVDEDAKRMEEERRAKVYMSAFTDPVRYDILEGHVLIVGGNEDNPSIKVLHPHPNGVREVAVLQGHKHAVTHIEVDCAGRWIFSASSADDTILIWDALTLTCERQIDNVKIGNLILCFNCMLVSSFKAPFLRMWKTKYSNATYSTALKAGKTAAANGNTAEITDNNEQMKPVPDASEKKPLLEFIHDEFSNANDAISSELISEEDRIIAVRSSRWCYSVLKGTSYLPVKAIVEPTYISSEAVVVVRRWQTHYTRQDADEVSTSLLQTTAPHTLTMDTINAINKVPEEKPRTLFGFSKSTNDLKSPKVGFVERSRKRMNRRQNGMSHGHDETQNRSDHKDSVDINLEISSSFSTSLDSADSNHESAVSVHQFFITTLKSTEEKSDENTESGSDSGDSVAKYKQRLANWKKVKLPREHFSDSDEEESERVTYFNAGRSERRREITIEEIAMKKLEMEKLKVVVVQERQKKLRPRMVHHFSDQFDDNDD